MGAPPRLQPTYEDSHIAHSGSCFTSYCHPRLRSHPLQCSGPSRANASRRDSQPHQVLRFLASKSAWLDGNDSQDDTPLHLAARCVIRAMRLPSRCLAASHSLGRKPADRAASSKPHQHGCCLLLAAWNNHSCTPSQSVFCEACPPYIGTQSPFSSGVAGCLGILSCLLAPCPPSATPLWTSLVKHRSYPSTPDLIFITTRRRGWLPGVFLPPHTY